MASYEHTTHAEPAYVENAYIENGLHPVHHSDKIVGGPIEHQTASASAAATTWVEISDWEYVGCYRDNDQRTMRDAYQNYTTSQTNRQCKAFCEKDYDYFASVPVTGAFRDGTRIPSANVRGPDMSSAYYISAADAPVICMPET
ncbi:hypothetical protein CGCVW01_v012788 [Colletotrichum viniferum]|nr:hypothetical protein CGCVW01_v012788 [Colletotrichum viniferum]